MGLFIHKIKNYETTDYRKYQQACGNPGTGFGILMLTDKGIMPTGMIAMLLLIGGIIGFLFRALLLIVRIAFIFFIVGLLFF